MSDVTVIQRGKLSPYNCLIFCNITYISALFFLTGTALRRQITTVAFTGSTVHQLRLFSGKNGTIITCLTITINTDY